MRLLLIHQYFAGPTEPGGTRHYELASHLVRQGHECTLVASTLNYTSGQRAVEGWGLSVEQNLDGIRVLRSYTVPLLHHSFAGRVLALVSFMITSVWSALRAKNIDIVMGTSPPLFQAVSAWFVSLVRRRPFLLEIRDLWPEFAIDIGLLKNPVLIKIARWVENFLYRRATHLLVNSPAYRDYLLAKGVPDEKISVIANGVDPNMFSPEDDGHAFRDELKVGDKFVVTYAGALGMANDIDTILRAAARLRTDTRIRLLLVGDGKERPNLEAKAKRFELANIMFVGTRTKTAMRSVLAGSDACVATLKNIPMFRTTYPNKVFDYMAAGRPTILGIDGVIRKVVDAAGGGIFVPPGDDRALAAACQQLCDDRERSRAMGLAARRYVVEHFNRHQQGQDFVRLLERLANVAKSEQGEPPVPDVRQTCV
jgi:glycosyltransferase involved in cell wall biosynthesis